MPVRFKVRNSSFVASHFYLQNCKFEQIKDSGAPGLAACLTSSSIFKQFTFIMKKNSNTCQVIQILLVIICCFRKTGILQKPCTPTTICEMHI